MYVRGIGREKNEKGYVWQHNRKEGKKKSVCGGRIGR